MKILMLTMFLGLCLSTSNAQIKNTVSTDGFAANLKKLVELNRQTPGLIIVSNEEAANITNNASVEQIIEITAPYMEDETPNTKSVCYYFLVGILLKKTESENQKQQIVEILCKNYLSQKQVYNVGNLVSLKEKDFNRNARKYIATLVDSTNLFYNTTCYKLLGLVQIKKSIPLLWKLFNERKANVGQGELDILASLARMNEEKAAILLCNYYDSLRKEKGYWGVMSAKNLVFSMDKKVLDCLINDYKKIDVNYSFREFDYGLAPGHILGSAIASMLKDYPYKKDENGINPKQLLDWLNKKKNYKLGEK